MTPPPDTDPPAEPAAPGYAAALAELDEILRELEGSAVDVDRLADRVARAAELVAICRDRIGTARLRVEQIVVGLDAVDGAGTDREPGEAPGGESP